MILLLFSPTILILIVGAYYQGKADGIRWCSKQLEGQING